MPERVRAEIEEVIGIDASHAIPASAKEGIGTEDILEGIVHYFPPPKGDPDAPLRALIIDSWFDPYHGAVVMTRVFDGTMKKGTKIRMMSSGGAFEVLRLGVFSPVPTEVAGTQSRRSWLSYGRHQRSGRDPHRRHDYHRRTAGGRAAAGIQADEADGL